MAGPFYVPSESGWAATGTYGNLVYVRLEVSQEYNSSTNKSTLTIKVQAKGVSGAYGGTYNVISAAPITGVLKCNSSTLVDFASSSPYYKVTIDDTGAWKDVTNDSLPSTWTKEITHDSSGQATVSFEFDAQLYMYSSQVGNVTEDFESDTGTLAISGNVAGTAQIYDGSNWVECEPYVYDGSNWVRCEPYVYTSNGWVKH